VFGTGGYLGICTLLFQPKKIAQVLVESEDSVPSTVQYSEPLYVKKEPWVYAEYIEEG
jgi:hypothetical protein